MPLVTLDRDGNVAVVTLNRPEAMNALSAALRAELAATMVELEADSSIHVVILTGAGIVPLPLGSTLKSWAQIQATWAMPMPQMRSATQ